MAAVVCEQKAIRDLSDVVKVLCAVGFNVRWVDAAASSDVTPTGAGEREPICGCRVVVTCTKSGLRAVLETSREECTCSVQQLHVAAGSQEVTNPNTIISPLSQPAALMLRELLIRLTNSNAEDGNAASTGLTDVSETSCSTPDVQKQKSNLQVRPALSSRRNLFGSVDELLTSLLPYRDNEVISCPSSPVAGDMMRVEMLQSSSLEALSSKQNSGTFCRTLRPSPENRQPDDIERRLKMAASCIQEALTLHCRSRTGNRIDKNSISTPNLFKVPTVAGSKAKSATKISKGESPNNDHKLIKPKQLTPYPGKRTKSSCADKPTAHGPTTSGRGRTPSGSVTSGRGRTPSGSVTSGRGRTPSGSVTSGRGQTPSGFSHLRTATQFVS